MILHSLACAIGIAIGDLHSIQAPDPALQKNAGEPALQLERTIVLTGVQGRIDHLALDAAHQVLYVAALGNDTLEIVDVAKGTLRSTRTGFHEPQGIAFLDATNDILVANGGSGKLDVLSDAGDRGIRVGPDADNVRFDPATKRVIVGYGAGGLALVRSANWLVEGLIDLGAHPESFQVAGDGKRVWVNLPEKDAIAVVDMELKRVERTIALKTAKKNFPMALDEADKRLLVGCRDPGRLLVIDIENDAQVAELPLSGDVDDVFVDSARGRVYASCGEGFVDVFERTGPGAWTPKEKIATRAGARTCLFDAASRKLFVAVPRSGEKPAEVRVLSSGK